MRYTDLLLLQTNTLQSAKEGESLEASAGSVDDALSFPKVHPSSKLRIRERLRRWEAENVTDVPSAPIDQDHGKPGHITNLYTRPMEGDLIREVEDGQQLEDSPQPLFERDDLVEFGSERSFLLRGDLVEIRFVMGSAY